MRDIPDVRYARSGGVAVAYQVVGEGDRTLVFVPFLSSLATLWELRQAREFFEQLSREKRLVLVNPRGMGLSDRPRTLTLEGWMDDIRSVLDEERIERATVFGVADGANASLLLAATYPERVERLILHRPFQKAGRVDDALEWVRQVREHWGEREFLTGIARHLNPQLAEDEEYLDWFVWNHRQSSSPASAAEYWRMQAATDITDIVGAVRVPTLVTAIADDRDGIDLAAKLPSGTCVVYPGSGASPFQAAVVEAVLAFVRGEAARPVPDTVLATVLFTDLVGSTAIAAELGDRPWREVLERHHEAVQREVTRYRGEVVDTAGDGFFCRFDGPARAIACAREIVAAAPQLGLSVRAGVHTGECELAGPKLAGIAVHIGARVSATAAPGEVLVSNTVRDLVAGSGFRFENRGEHELKGVPESLRLWAVVD